MIISILSRENMRKALREDSDLLDKTRIISINDPEIPRLFGNNNLKDYGLLIDKAHENVLSLVFHDIQYYPCSYFDDGGMLFTRQHATLIIEFLLAHPTYIDPTKEKDLIVHCYAGISRSAAIGLFAAELFKIPERVYREHNPKIVPNMFIYRTLVDTYHSIYEDDHKNFLS